RAQDDHRPAHLGWSRALPGSALNLLDRVEHGVERLGQAAVDVLGRLAVEAPRDHVRLPAVAPQEREEILLRDPGEDRGVRDLVAVQVEDRQHDPAAPSPTTHTTRRSGLSNAAPNAWTSE